ncbi:MAG: M18 family aminopeptidase [Lachnospiraceae bacterium]|nr:M18 family aminopeptidase [Lachnospiraceae bacterium]
MSGKEQALQQVRQMLDFIDNSPCCYQAVENAEAELERAGYIRLEEWEYWRLEGGGKYYVDRNGSSLIAFALPEKDMRGFHMIAAHSDSPAFKIKEMPEIRVENRYVKLNVEKYGGMILSSWLDRPLSAAGRIVTTGSTGPVAKRVNLDRDLFIIPNLAIHMNPEMNKGTEYNVQTDMLPLFGGGDGGKSLTELAAEAAGVDAGAVLGSDLFLYNREKGRIIGADEEFICSSRLDDLECVYCSLRAMLAAKPGFYANFMIVFDNEEVGSLTRQGAASSFLQDTLLRICEALGLFGQDYGRLLAESFMLSADNAHGVHPNHPEKADPTNRPYLNGGVVIKYHGSQKYTTDGISGAVMKEICRRAGVPYQTYANRSDMAGGSTLGNISAARVPVRTADIGLAQLAMHSAYETAGARDVEYMIKAMSCFYGQGGCQTKA